ncbi:MAG: tripartite tricarboxylate transporter substrate binding protein [Acidobacteria bacterium]|nr:tripartite tricarboxylate transporter substrate binding protein [Acidobacteriota bacterium]
MTPYGAGGGIDLAARILSAVAEPHLGTRVDVVNMPGAGGLNAATFVKNAAPDGATLLISDYGPLITLPLREETPYGTADWVPLVQVAEIAPTFVVRGGSGLQTVSALVDAARASPGGIAMTHGAFMSSSHLPLLRLEQLAGVRTNHVPTAGGAETVQFLLSGVVQAAVTTPGSIAGSVQSGRAAAIAVATAERVAELPDTPTLRESGYDIVMPVWHTIFASAAVPAARRLILAERIAAAYASQEAQELAGRARIAIEPITGETVRDIYVRTVDAVRVILDDLHKQQ